MIINISVVISKIHGMCKKHKPNPGTYKKIGCDCREKNGGNHGNHCQPYKKPFHTKGKSLINFLIIKSILQWSISYKVLADYPQYTPGAA